ncbi:MAG: molybdopterin synthase catalytic subunit [Verrucomicrobiota bacterium]|jgi:molybdopterin synthase catalytic subunit
MAISLCEVSIGESPLTPPDVNWEPCSGGIVDFWGVVREEENGDKIDGLQYEAHGAMAEHQLKVIAQKAVKDFGLTRVVLRHRIGFVRAGEPSLFLRVAAARRKAAFAASQWIVEELKRRVPIWKRPIFVQPAASLDRHKESSQSLA